MFQIIVLSLNYLCTDSIICPQINLTRTLFMLRSIIIMLGMLTEARFTVICIQLILYWKTIRMNSRRLRQVIYRNIASQDLLFPAIKLNKDLFFLLANGLLKLFIIQNTLVQFCYKTYFILRCKWVNYLSSLLHKIFSNFPYDTNLITTCHSI